MTDQDQTQLPTATAKILDELPQLIGAVDRFLIDTSGERIPFVVVAFTAGRAIHATNINPPAVAFDALKELVKSME
jgi:hypothetical protein